MDEKSFVTNNVDEYVFGGQTSKNTPFFTKKNIGLDERSDWISFKRKDDFFYDRNSKGDGYFLSKVWMYPSVIQFFWICKAL